MKKKVLSLLLALVMIFSLAIPALADEVTPGQTAPVGSTEGVTTGETAPVGSVEEGTIVILHSNDVHGAIEGYAKMAALKDRYEAAGAQVIVVDAGDYIQGTTYVSVSQGETAIELMNMAGYSLSALGNHEFDYGYANMKALEEKADFDILAANVLYEGEPAFGTCKILEVGDTKIGFFGLDTPETATKAHPAKIKGVTFQGGEELYDTAQAQVDALKAEGADVIICLGHLGIDDETAATANRSIDLLEKVTGIDVFIDGHSHSTLEEIAAKTNADRKVGDTVITSTGTKFANIGVVTILNGEITTECVDTSTITVAEDDPIAVRAAEIEAEIEADYGATFATSEVDLNGERAPGNRTEETNLGDLITDSMLWYATKEELDVPAENVVAVTNGGGIRAAIAAGDVSKNDVNTVLPFGNTVAVVYVTGADLLEALEASTYCTPTSLGGFPQIAGMSITVDTSKAFDQGELYPDTTYFAPASINRVTIDSVNGAAFDPAATYAVVTNDFVAAGGDTYYSFSVSDRITDTGTPLDEALMQYITDELGGVISDSYAAPQGRITVLYADTDFAAWYGEAVRDVLDKGLMVGTGTGFAPEGTVTRATVFQTLYNMEGKPSVDNKMATFPDAQGKWYEDAARWAEQMELTTGTGTGFEGDRDVTRQEIATILYRYATWKGQDVTLGQDAALNYADAANVADWAVAAMKWTVATKVMVGRSAATLNPGDTAIRAELAQILSNYAAVAPAADKAVLSGKTASVSKYGNVTTDIKMEDVTAAGYEVGDILKVELTGQEAMLVPYGTGYSNVDQGSPIALEDADTSTLALAINRGDFATTYGLGVKAEDGTWTLDKDKTITISMGEKGGYLEEMEVRELDSKRTNNREDYTSDEVFANFRAITLGDIADGVLYRTSSPINPELGRNTYADEIIEAAGVKTVVNLADCVETAQAYEGFADTYYAALDADGGVVYLNMGVDMYSDEALGDLKNGLEFMVENPGPYAFHCTEGKDRAGYFAFLLEALMGAELDDIVDDYMLSFENYYHVENGSEQWTKLAASNIEKDVLVLTGAADITAAKEVDLQAAAEKYMIETLGLTQEQVDTLKTNLSTPISE